MANNKELKEEIIPDISEEIQESFDMADTGAIVTYGKQGGIIIDKRTGANVDDYERLDVSEAHMEKIARGYFVGKTAFNKRRDVRKLLEQHVIERIGKKGKFLVDKLFELIEGVYIVDSLKPSHGKEDMRYYKVPPNLQAIIYAIDSVMGKPKQLNVQANFSLSQLLIKTDGSGSRDNEEISE